MNNTLRIFGRASGQICCQILVVIGCLFGTASAEEPRIDLETRGALWLWDRGDLLTPNQIDRIVRYLRLKDMKSPLSSLDLSMRKALFKMEIGHPMDGSDYTWVTRFLDKPGAKVDVIEANRTINYGPSPKLSQFQPVRKCTEFLRDSSSGWESVVVAKVLKRNHSCIFQRKNGEYWIFKYSGGILYNNYFEGAVLWASMDSGILQRTSQNQSAKFTAIKLR